jgi:hypothetical protein
MENIINTVVFVKSGNDAISVLIYLRIDGKALIVRSGFITLTPLNALKFRSNENISIILYNKEVNVCCHDVKKFYFQNSYPEMTIIKSMMFHPSLKYDFLFRTNPIPIILSTASNIKIAVSTLSIVSMT